MKKNQKITVSVALATYNEEKNLERCLNSVKGLADEIVIVDGGSSDRTVELARKYTDNVIVTDNPPIFHINKQKAIEKCHGEWIVQLDADEEIPSDLKEEILSVVQSENSVAGYYIARNNYFCGKLMRKGGMYPDYVIRLFRNGKGHFPCKSVHEQISITGEVGYLKHAMNHYPYPTFADYLKKADTYTNLTANEFEESKLPLTAFTALYYTVLLPLKTFLNLYIRHKGFLDGWWGFVWALYSGLHHAQAFRKYVKSK